MASLSLNQFILKKSQCSSLPRATYRQEVWRGKNALGTNLAESVTISANNNTLLGSFYFRKASDFFQCNKLELRIKTCFRKYSLKPQNAASPYENKWFLLIKIQS